VVELTSLVGLILQAIIDGLQGIWAFEISFTIGNVITLVLLALVLLWLVVKGVKAFIKLAGTFVYTIVRNAMGAGLEAWRAKNGSDKK
jgi:hypothetical protein